MFDIIQDVFQCVRRIYGVLFLVCQEAQICAVLFSLFTFHIYLLRMYLDWDII